MVGKRNLGERVEMVKRGSGVLEINVKLCLKPLSIDLSLVPNTNANLISN